MENTQNPTPEDVAALVDETTAVLTGEKPAEEITEDVPEQQTATDATQNVATEEQPPEEQKDRINVFGRPTKFTPETIPEAIKYIESCVDKTVIEQVYVEGIHDEDAEVEDEPEDGDDIDEGEDKPEKRYKKKPLIRYDVQHLVKMPTRGGLAFHLKVSRETLYAWARENEDFSDIMEYLGAIQEDRLINKGLSGKYNPTISKVLLTKHGYREGIDATTNDKDIGTVNEARVLKKAEAILDTSQ